ncbi:hypothetical protein [Spiroplasma endosymbiont of Labia minor]|uniref:hypothetical protein n=1 Tax=Spiroplasma endosymbiont of Labia minor TaxID=3066305 RepID=UPI0030CF39C8
MEHKLQNYSEHYYHGKIVFPEIYIWLKLKFQESKFNKKVLINAKIATKKGLIPSSKITCQQAWDCIDIMESHILELIYDIGYLKRKV